MANPALEALFAPRKPLRYLEPIDVPPAKRCTPPIDGVAALLDQVANYKQTFQDEWTKTKLQLTREKRLLKQNVTKTRISQELADWHPENDGNIKSDPYCTLFVGRLRYTVEDNDLMNHFSKYGKIQSIQIICDKETGKPKGYAFVVFSSPLEMRNAMRYENGSLIKGRRVVTDSQRSLIQNSWRPRRLGGGRGGRHGLKKQLVELANPRKRPHTQDRRQVKEPRTNYHNNNRGPNGRNHRDFRNSRDEKSHGQQEDRPAHYRERDSIGRMQTQKPGIRTDNSSNYRPYGNRYDQGRPMNRDNRDSRPDTRGSYKADYRSDQTARPHRPNGDATRSDPRSNSRMDPRMDSRVDPRGERVDPRASGRVLRKY